MKESELVILGVVIFIAVVVADLWMQQQRFLIAGELTAYLAQPQKAPAIINGFADVA